MKSNIIDNSLLEIDDEESCKKNAEKYIRNKVVDKTTIEKLVRRLQGMGYTWETIKSTLNYLKYETE